MRLSLEAVFHMNLVDAMEERGLTYLTLAKKSKMSESHIRGIANGDYGTTFKSAQRIADAMNMSPFDLLKEPV